MLSEKAEEKHLNQNENEDIKAHCCDGKDHAFKSKCPPYKRNLFARRFKKNSELI
jgi:hypothetical protein